MWKNYFLTAIRNILRHILHTFINIAGLSIGMAAVILISLYVLQELGTDKFHKKLNDIYRVSVDEFNGTLSIPPTFVDSVGNSFPEIRKLVRTQSRSGKILTYNNKQFFEDILLADSSFFDVFSFPIVQGDLSKSLTEPLSIVLTEKIARKIFGNDDPLGKGITFDLKHQLTVTGIIKDIPQNSSLHFTAVVSLISLNQIQGPEALHQPTEFNFPTYILLNENQNPEVVEQKLGKNKYKLHPFKDAYFYSTHNDSLKHGNITLVKAFIIIALLILLIAIINYINLSTAKSSLRSNEIGVRKVFGAFKKQLVIQLLTESLIISFLALCLAIIIANSFIPKISELSETHLTNIQMDSPLKWLIFISTLILLTFISGLYPAFYITSQKPVNMLKNKILKGSNGLILRKSLIVFQFFICIILIICTLAIQRQIDFINNKDLGFQKENIVNVTLNAGMEQKFDVFKQKLIQNPSIHNVVLSMGSPANLGIQISRSLTYRGQKLDLECYAILVQPDYIETLGFEIIKGRSFSKDLITDEGNFILNEAAIKSVNVAEPLELQFGSDSPDKGKVIGIVKDFHFRSMYDPIKPFAFLCMNKWCKLVNIKIDSKNKEQTVEQIRKIWDELSPDYPFLYSFLDQNVADQYIKENKIEKIFTWFAILAVFIACLGLFGLAMFEAQQRTKEIGIRKVNGASILNIMFKLSLNFTKWVVLGFILACPIAYYSINLWLQYFAYKTQPGYAVFLISGAIALIIALFTVSWQSWQAASRNPVEALRYE